MKAKTIGMVGGIGPESTIDYYRMLTGRFKASRIDNYKSILINSIDLDRVLVFLDANDRPGLIGYMLEAVERLARGGADLAFFAANTPHLVFDEVQALSPIPLVSIVAATCDAAVEMGLTRVGLIGTRFTMNGGFFTRYFLARDIEVLAPSADDQNYVHEKYFSELVPGKFIEETRDGIVAVMDRLRLEHSVDAIILGGTELPLLLRGVEYPVPLLDTARIHVDAIVREALLDG